MTRLITVLIIVVVAFCAWQGYKFAREEMNKEDKEKVDTTPLRGDQLPGLPYRLDSSYHNVKQDSDTFRKWLKTYADQIEDPRRAWIELDFCVLVTRENPAEARALFEQVKARTGPSSPVYPRVKELEKTYN
jgi:hypothetical protein